MFDKNTNQDIARMVWTVKEKEQKGKLAEKAVDTILTDSMKKMSYDNLTAIFIDVKGLFG